MLRSGYSSEAVLHELSARKFADTFDSEIEKQLVRAGASPVLIDALRSGVDQLSPAEIAAQQRMATLAELTARPASPDRAQSTSNVSAPSITPPQVRQIGGSIYDHLKDDLVIRHEGTLVPFDNEALERKKFYLLFFSAIWSREGRQFTPRLVDYYNRVASEHPEFELVFFSADRSSFAMENYMSQMNMPWPAVDYDKLRGKAGAIAQSLTQVIPRLILADASGKVLADSGESQPNFDKVLADTDKILANSK